MQRELADTGNKYEIIDFVKSRIKMSIGLERAPKPASILKEQNDRIGNKSDIDDNNENADPNVTGLPTKVDEFMSYINRVYFDGKLEQDGKQFFKSDIEGTTHDENDLPVGHSRRPIRKILITT